MRPAVFMPSVSVPEPLPATGDTVSHGAFDVAAQERLSPPEFEMLTVCEAGELPPSVYVKLTLLADSEIDGGGALTARLTKIACGLLLAPAAVTAMVPL